MTASPSAFLIDAALRGMLLSLLLLLAGVLLRDRPRLPAARAAVAMCLGLCVQVVSSTPLFEALVPRLWQAPLVAVSVANAVLFWIFAQALFDDDFTLRPAHAAAWLAVAALSGVNCALGGGGVGGSGAIALQVGLGLQRGVPLLFAVLAAMVAAARWDADLVEGRRRARVFIVVTGVVYTLTTLALRLASPHGRLSDGSSLFDVAALLFIVAAAAWQFLSLGGSDLFPSEACAVAPVPHGALAEAATGAPADVPTTTTALPDPVDDRLADALHQLMSVERAYRSDDLSVSSLAARLSAPAYRLRRVINQRLGHRNFNAYVNGLRLDDACAALADPGRRKLPVLTIALDAGFQSIGPFNRAFKAACGLTPTEFRQKHLSDS